ncbi:MAG TPA: MlaD family protein [Flavisolibacter sp.]
MARRTINNLKLGIFVLAGLAVLIILLYVIGRNEYLFGNTFELKARFENVNGLMPGNNIRFAGIDAGTIRSVQVLDDTTIEVTLRVRNDMKKYIRKNAEVSIGTDGLMGNKLLNIRSARVPAPLVEEGDILVTAPGVDTDEILKVLNATTGDIAVVVSELRKSVKRFNESSALWTLISDESVPAGISASVSRIRMASARMDDMMAGLDLIVTDVREGKGTLGKLLRDSAIALDIRASVQKLGSIGASADSLTARISVLVNSISRQVQNPDGTVHALLADPKMAESVSKSLQHIEEGTRAFNENMEALKHSFLFRGYFNKIERRKKEVTTSVY